ncbi:helix-turn-helix domain-containing protein [Burkholderia ubonensis]|uniref:helix-turn-helix domain-containing protein n=1 Tax=Burkholderia ubonensis TaxID=101571 RepID=UPI000A8F6DA4|nr:helix-turn-helix domain-containing protein [Burkholderia ubonensis]
MLEEILTLDGHALESHPNSDSPAAFSHLSFIFHTPNFPPQPGSEVPYIRGAVQKDELMRKPNDANEKVTCSRTVELQSEHHTAPPSWPVQLHRNGCSISPKYASCVLERDMHNPMIFEFSTLNYATQEKLDAWRDQNRLADVNPRKAGTSMLDSNFLGIHINQIMFGSLTHIANLQSDFIRYDAIRSRRNIQQDGCDHYYFRTSAVHAWQANIHGHSVQVLPNQIAIIDLSKPCQVEIQAGNVVILMIPRNVIPFDISNRGDAIITNTLATLFSQYLHTLASKIRDISSAEAPGIAQATLGMLVAALMPNQDNLRQTQEYFSTEIFNKIKKYIDVNLKSPSLRVEKICKDMGLSRARLYRIFAENGTGVAEYIKLARLRKIYSILLVPATEKPRLSDLAYQYGFYSTSALSKDFKRSFGCTPNEIQHSAWNSLTIEDECPYGISHDFKHWHKI